MKTRKLSQAEKAQRWDEYIAKQKVYYQANRDKRLAYAKKRHAEMQAALNKERGRK
jgi:hypothetical protein